MVISEDVFSYHGQCLAKQNTPVTLQLIEHLKFYQIASVSIFPENHGDRNSSTMTARRLETYSQRIRRSPEFQRFKTDYTKKVSFMKENINNFIVNDEDLNVDQLLDETLTLFGENSTTISMFDMLHNMRQIDDSTYAHSVNVALICRLIGKWKNFSEKDMDTLTLCGLLHDIGKSKIPNEIIGKPGKLTDSEYEEIKKHPVIGYNMVKNLNIDQRVKNAVLFHHDVGIQAQLALGQRLRGQGQRVVRGDGKHPADRANLGVIDPAAVQQGIRRANGDVRLIIDDRIPDAVIDLGSDGDLAGRKLLFQHLEQPRGMARRI